MAGFAFEIQNFANDVNRINEDVRRAFIIKLFGAIIDSTPVDTGRAKNNWRTSVNQPNREELIDGDKAGLRPKREVQSNLGKGDVDVWMVNNLPYIVALEEGHSKDSPPEAMVRANLNRQGAIFREAVFEVRR